MQVEPYLVFDGRCEEAINFYKSALGAKVEMLMRFNDSPDPSAKANLPPGGENKVMHASLRIGDSRVMASDGHCTGTAKFAGFSLSISVSNEAEADRVFAALSDGGNVSMPLGKTFFSRRFGIVTDRFGMTWMIIAQQ